MTDIVNWANIFSAVFSLIGLFLAGWAIFISKKQLQQSLDDTNKQLAKVSEIIHEIKINQNITNNHTYENSPVRSENTGNYSGNIENSANAGHGNNNK